MDAFPFRRKVLTWFAVVFCSASLFLIEFLNKYSRVKIPMTLVTVLVIYAVPIVILVLSSGLPQWTRERFFESKMVFLDCKERRKLAIFATVLFFLARSLFVVSVAHFSFKGSLGVIRPLVLLDLFLSAFLEEVLMKGCVFRLLADGKEEKIYAIVLTSVIFAIAHGKLNIFIMFQHFLFQFIPLLIFNYYPSILIPTMLHFLCNVFSVVSFGL